MRVNALLTGELRPLGRRAVPSGIAKAPVEGPVALTSTGLAGDAQGDTKRHGGPEKAVHHYPFDHYANWSSELRPVDLLAQPGAFGENISTLGLTEQTVAVGDTFALGSAVLQVSQGRQPCWKLDERLGVPGMAAKVQASGRTGWYYRVLQPGAVAAGDDLRLLDRVSPDWTLRRIWHAFYIDRLNWDELDAISRLETLAKGWRDHAARRLATGKVEDWSLRLTGRAGDL